MWVFVRLARQAAIAALLLAAFSAPARAQRRGEGEELPRRENRESGIQSDRDPRGYPGGYGRVYEGPTEGSTRQGFLFINGEYVSPSYEIRLTDGEMWVNGKKLECQPPSRGYGRGYGPGPYGPYGPRTADAQPWRYMVGELQGQLGSDMAVFCFAEQPYVVLDSSATYDLLKAMTAENGRALRQVSVREKLPEQFDKAVWDAWVETFEPSGELLNRAAVLINSFEAAQREADADMRATRLLNRFAYPLAVGGMVLSVLAIGHLLGGRPHAREQAIGRDESPAMIHSLNWSLMFVAAFTLLDLTWTILAANAGQMHELNPIGSHLIENPRHLAGFKLGITLPSLALLWLLRKHKRAQVAAWWICLVLTFVTLRWLALSPLFVGV
jgi:hypothetical protein